MIRSRLLVVAFAIGLVAAACGDDDEPEATTSVAPAAPDDDEHHMDDMDHSDPEHNMEDMDHGDDGHHGGDGDAEADPADVESGFAALVNGHHAAIEPEPLDEATQAELDAQLAITREVAETYPTVADAVTAGYRRAGPFSPGLGAHYTRTSAEGLNADGVMSDADLRNPLSIIYTGTDPGDEIVGFMYYAMTADVPEGFAGDNDFWHYHTSVCIKAAEDGIDAPFGADVEVPEGLCEKAGGSMLEQTQYMVHVWTVPGYEVDEADGGVFGEVNRNVPCDDGSYHILEMEDWIEYPLNVCKNNPA